jgi:hypothetical protein
MGKLRSGLSASSCVRFHKRYVSFRFTKKVEQDNQKFGFWG